MGLVVGQAVERLESRTMLSATISYPAPAGFNTTGNTGSLTYGGSAKLNGSNASLTTAGSQVASAFYSLPQSVDGFTTSFTFSQAATQINQSLADGMTFTLQNVGGTYQSPSSWGGGGLGYANDAGNGGYGHSIAIKFDLYQNSSEGSNSTGLFVNGDSPTSVLPGDNAADISVPITGLTLASGHAMTVTLIYNGTTLTETIQDGSTNASFTKSYTINIANTIGSATAYAGFTAGTGGLFSNQSVSAWTYTPDNTVLPYAPTGLTVTPASGTENDLAWTPPYSAVTAYNILRQIGGVYTQVGTVTSTTFADTGLSPGTTYSYEVVAVNGNGSSPAGAATSATTLYKAPLISNLTATGVTSTAAALNWQNIGTTATSITIVRTLVPDNTAVTTTLAAGSTTFTDGTLSAGREYDYAVEANTATGPTQARTVAVQTTPGAVQNLDGTVNQTTVNLQWDPLGYAVGTYNIYRGTTPGGEGATPIATGVTGTSYADQGLTPGVTYYYTVTATDTGGEGPAGGELSALALPPAAALVISEFDADDKTGLKDAAGAYSDWIEIHNAGLGAANLHDYYLTDDASDLQLWQFPVQTLAAGGYLLVFADGANVSVAGSELHTNFSLASAGEYLALSNVNETIQSQFNPYPAQSADISYGLSDSDNPASPYVYFGTPTPGAANAPTASPATFSQPGGDFAGTKTLTLASPTSGAKIYYSTDTTAPSSTSNSSTLYTGPITISKTETVRARVYATGYTASVVDSQTYLDLSTTATNGNSAAGFSNNLGIVVIDTYGKALNDTTDQLAGATFIPAGNGTATAVGSTANYTGRIGLHIRGNTSEGFAKQQWGITLWDENNNNTKASLFGMPSDDKWILNDPYSEKSLEQNPLSYEWANQAGDYASRTQYVEVFFNTTGSSTISYASNYWGVYILEERIKIASGRVDINSMSTTDVTAPADTGGYIFEKDRPAADDATFTTSVYGQTFLMIDPNADDINGTQLSYIGNYVNQFETALSGPNFASPTLGYAAYINVSTFVNTWLIEEMIKNVDGFRLSSYYYKDENGLLCAGPIWDNNLALGNSNYSPENLTDPVDFGSNPDLFDSSQLAARDYPYYGRLFQDPAFKQAVVDRWSQLRSTVFTTAKLEADVDAFTNQLSNNTTNYPVGANGATPTQAPTDPVVRNFVRWPVLGVYGWPNGWVDSAGRWIEEVNMMKNWIAARVSWMDGQLLPAPVPSLPGGSYTSAVSVTLTPDTTTAADTILSAANAAASYFVPTSSNNAPSPSTWTATNYAPTNWTAGTASVGYSTDGSLSGLITSNVQSAMYTVGSGIYLRVPFTVANPSSIQSLILRLNYDDGFVAYVNGIQVAYENATMTNDRFSVTSPTTFATATATASRTESTALTYGDFDISAFKDALVAGTNVLAIQGLNSSKNNTDFLLAPQLISRVWAPAVTAATTGTLPVTYYTTNGTDPRNADGSVNAAAMVYSSALTFGVNTTINTRSLLNNSWSGLSTSVYQFAKPTVAITELNYDPAKPPTGSAYNNDDFEYIEFENYGTVPVNLNGLNFTKGIKYTFGNVTLAPGQVGVLVHNTAAFQSRYGTSIDIIGDYLSTGESFNNSGEEVTFNDALGNVLYDFTYSPSWFASAHGSGGSMDVVNPASVPNLSLAGNWSLDPTLNGTPGTVPLVLTGNSYYLQMDAAKANLDVYTGAAVTATPTYIVPLSQLNAMTFTAAAAASLTLDYSNGIPLIGGGLTFNGNGVGTLNIVGTSGDDTLTVNGTTATLASAAGSSVVTYISAAAVTFNGGLGSDTLTQAAQPGGSTTLALLNPTAADTLNVAAGTYTVAAPAAGTGVNAVSLGTLSIGANAKVSLANAVSHSDRTILKAANLTLAGTTGAWTGTLDLGWNDLDVTAGNVAQLANQLAQGAASDTWTGSGITSSTAAADSTHVTAVGLLANADVNNNPVYGSGTTAGLFDGQNPGASDVLLKYTYYGDANLDGQVDGSDYSELDNAYNTGNLTGWSNGDFNGDGVVNGSDYSLIDNAFNTQAGRLSANSTGLFASTTSQIAGKSSKASAKAPAPVASNRYATVFAAATPLSTGAINLNSPDWLDQLMGKGK